jgi:predicted transcriptional regulator
MAADQEQERARARAGTTRRPRFSLPLDDETSDRLKRLAFDRGSSQAVIAEDAVKQYLDQADA